MVDGPSPTVSSSQQWFRAFWWLSLLKVLLFKPIISEKLFSKLLFIACNVTASM